MSKHRDVPLVGRGWRALCSAVPLFLILATMIIVPPVAIAQEAPSTGATGASGATGAVGATGATPTITSDKADYQPGASVTLTGAGWADGENVHIVVNDTIGQTWQYQSDVVATTGGSFTDSFNLPNYFVSDYDVTASGPVSGTATTTFTDAPLKITGKQHEGQSSTGGYTSGNTNTYKEGDFINFHFTLDSNDATSGTDPSHGFLEVRFTGDDSTCLFFDGSFALGAIDIPSTAGNDSAPAVVSVSGAVPTVVPTGPPVPADFGTSGGEWVQTLEVTFSDFGVAVINYHLRLSDQAGECNGASQHSRLNPPANAGDFTQTGQQNIPVPANQVIELPEIIVNKLIDRDGNGSFESTAAAGEYKFCLDGSVNCQNTNASGQVTFTNVTPDGAHNITEAQLVFTQGTYVFDSIIGTNCVANGTTAVATIASGTTATDAVCTFRNKANQGKIELRKHWVGTPGEVTLNIGTAAGGSQTATKDLTGANKGDGTTGETAVDTGTYFVSEDPNPITDYSTTLDCINTADGDAVVPVDADGGVAVATGDAVVCTFTNTRDQGTIELKKHWVGTVGEVKLNIGTDKNGNQIDSEDLTGANKGDGTTDANTVDTGTYFVSEDPNPITDYSTTLDCINTADGDAVVPVDADGGVAVATGDAVVCTFTNTRDQGTIELKKHWVGTVGEVKLNIGTDKNGNQIDSEDLTGANKGDGTTDANTVDTGTYFVSEDPNPITDYSTTLDCINTADGDAVVPVDADGGVAVATGDAVVCTFTNTRDQGTIELKKHWVGTVGEVKLNIGTDKNGNQIDSEDLTGANKGDGTTDANTVDTGTYFVSEDPNPITDYSTTLDCINTADGDAVVPVDADGGVAVATGDAVVCTFTNTRDRGTIELRKVWSGTVGEVVLNIGTSAGGSQTATKDLTGANKGNGTTGETAVDTGTFFVSEDPNPITNYSTTLACFNDNGDGAGGIADDGIKNGTEPDVSVAANGSVAVTTASDVVCTFTNTRDRGKIELRKVWSGTVGEVTLNIGTSAGGSQTATKDLTGANKGNGTTGETAVDTGTFFVSENPNPIAGYTTTLACFNDNGAGGGTANDGIKNGTEPDVSVAANGSVSVTTGSDIVCTFTNTRDRGKIELRKVWVGVPGQTTLQIGTTAGAANVDSQLTGPAGTPPLTTGENAVDTATYFVSEVGGLAGYSTSVACFNDIGGGTGGVANDGIKNGTEPTLAVGANGSVVVGKNADVVCTFTNTKFVHPGTIGFWKNWRNKYNATQMGTIINYIIVHNPLVYATPDLTIAIYDAIFNYGNGTPRDQQILGQLTALKSNLAVSALNPSPPQYNDSICTTGTVNVAGISGATAFFGTATPTIGQVVNKIETTWNGTLDTNRNHWSFNLSTAQMNIAISTLTGINEGTIIVTTC